MRLLSLFIVQGLYLQLVFPLAWKIITIQKAALYYDSTPVEHSDNKRIWIIAPWGILITLKTDGLQKEDLNRHKVSGLVRPTTLC